MNGSGARKLRPTLVAVAFLAALAQPARAAAPAPQLALSLDDVPIAESHPYDDAGDADRNIAAAMARAKIDGKRVLIEFGADWCIDCIILANVMRLPKAAEFVAAHYDAVLVDVGRFTQNLDVAERYGITLRRDGVPAVVIVDSDGEILNPGHTAVLADARHMQPQAIADWLARWAK